MDSLTDIADGHITTVQLASSRKGQTKFLRQLSDAIAESCTLSTLTPGPSDNVYVIPQNVQDAVWRIRGITSIDAWNLLLKQWGALSVNTLTRDAFFALQARGVTLVDSQVIGGGKISLPVPTPAASFDGPGFLPKDFEGPYDWQIDHRGVNAVAAWRMFAAEPRFASALPWADIQVGHIDTGYTEHAALGWDKGKSPTVQPSQGYDFWEGDHGPDPRDMWLPGFPGHGTRISAAIAGYGRSAPDHPFYGVAPGVQIVPYRVTDSVIVDHVQAHIAAAIRRAVNDGCHVINISLGALRRDKHVAAALDAAYDAGVIVVCAAGQVWGEVIYPGRFNRCITMGGVGPGLKPWSSGAKGIYVDLCAPADAIRRIKAENLAPGKASNAYYSKADGDGTSYATAACSGAAVLWLAWHGIDNLRARYAPHGLWQIPKAFKSMARQHATPGVWGSADAQNYGSGVLNIEATLNAPLPEDGAMVPALPAMDVFDPND